MQRQSYSQPNRGRRGHFPSNPQNRRGGRPYGRQQQHHSTPPPTSSFPPGPQYSSFSGPPPPCSFNVPPVSPTASVTPKFSGPNTPVLDPVLNISIDDAQLFSLIRQFLMDYQEGPMFKSVVHQLDDDLRGAKIPVSRHLAKNRLRTLLSYSAAYMYNIPAYNLHLQQLVNPSLQTTVKDISANVLSDPITQSFLNPDITEPLVVYPGSLQTVPLSKVLSTAPPPSHHHPPSHSPLVAPEKMDSLLQSGNLRRSTSLHGPPLKEPRASPQSDTSSRHQPRHQSRPGSLHRKVQSDSMQSSMSLRPLREVPVSSPPLQASPQTKREEPIKKTEPEPTWGPGSKAQREAIRKEKETRTEKEDLDELLYSDDELEEGKLFPQPIVSSKLLSLKTDVHPLAPVETTKKEEKTHDGPGEERTK
ncbi:hypothetical protein GEMRC1_006798 [Eukaryota sp. GEM-RC1]